MELMQLADAAAVCFDAVQHAKAHHLDAVIIDTAGRMHAAQPLMEELEKIIRVNKPDLVLLVIDSLVGNDAIEQLRKFKETRVDGVILTKSDLDKKGGVALSITASGTPIAFLATGQEYNKFEAYDPEKFLKKIMAS
jgi:fused signal recognition particle receptor